VVVAVARAAVDDVGRRKDAAKGEGVVAANTESSCYSLRERYEKRAAQRRGAWRT
jgi:hypothetical protein